MHLESLMVITDIKETAMRYLVVKLRGSYKLYWNGERFVMNVKRAATYAKIPAQQIARTQAGTIEGIR